MRVTKAIQNLTLLEKMELIRKTHRCVLALGMGQENYKVWVNLERSPKRPPSNEVFEGHDPNELLLKVIHVI